MMINSMKVLHLRTVNGKHISCVQTMAIKLAAYQFKIYYGSKNSQISSCKVECFCIQFHLTESKLNRFGVFQELRSSCAIFDIQR